MHEVNVVSGYQGSGSPGPRKFKWGESGPWLVGLLQPFLFIPLRAWPHMAFILRCYLALCIARYFINCYFSFTLALALLLQSFCLMGKHINKS